MKTPVIISLRIFLLITACLELNAQTNSVPDNMDKPLRVEFKAKSENETYRIIPFGEKGLLLFYKSLETVGNSMVNWYFIQYDSNLRQEWIKSIPIENTHEYVSGATSKDTIGLLFYGEGKGKEKTPGMMLLRIIPGKGVFISNPVVLSVNAFPVIMKFNGNKAYIGLNVKDAAARLMILDLPTGMPENVSLSSSMLSTVIGMQVDSVVPVVRIILKKQIEKNRSEMYFLEIDSSGIVKTEAAVTAISDDIYLQNAEFVKLPAGETLIIGTYGSASKQRGLSKKKMMEESTGFFFTRIEMGKQSTLTFVNFLSLKNISNVVDDKELASVRRKALKNNRDISDFSVDLNLILHPVIGQNGTFILPAEAYIPQYHSENFTDFDFYGRPFTNSYTVFDGYRFTSAMVVAFDEQGRVLWDNSMEIRNLLSFELTPKVELYFTSGKIVMTYLDEGRVASKIIKENDVVEKVDFSPVDPEFPNDKLISEKKGRLLHWYRNFFLCYGYQEIKNIALEGNNKRQVFYFSKLKFE